MQQIIKGIEGDYLIKNGTTILQYKKNKLGDNTGECLIHVITDTIENNEDRKNISKIMEEINFN